MAGVTLRTGGQSQGAYAQENVTPDENLLLKNGSPSAELPKYDARLLAQVLKQPLSHSRGKPEEMKKELSFELPYHLEIMIYPAALGLLCLLWCYVIAWTHKDAPGLSTQPVPGTTSAGQAYYYCPAGGVHQVLSNQRLRTTVSR